MGNGFKLTAQGVEEKLNYLNSQIGSTFKLEKRNTENPSVLEYGVFCNGRLFKVGSLSNIDSYIDGIYVGVGLPKANPQSTPQVNPKANANYNPHPSAVPLSSGGYLDNPIGTFFKSRQNREHWNKFQILGKKKALSNDFSGSGILYEIEVIEYAETHMVFSAEFSYLAPNQTIAGRVRYCSAQVLQLTPSMTLNEMALEITKICDREYINDIQLDLPNRFAHRYILTVTPDMPDAMGFSDNAVTTNVAAKVIS